MEAKRAQSSLERLTWLSKMGSSAAAKGVDVEELGGDINLALSHYSQALGYFAKASEITHFAANEREQANVLLDKMAQNKSLVEARLRVHQLPSVPSSPVTRVQPRVVAMETHAQEVQEPQPQQSGSFFDRIAKVLIGTPSSSSSSSSLSSSDWVHVPAKQVAPSQQPAAPQVFSVPLEKRTSSSQQSAVGPSVKPAAAVPRPQSKSAPTSSSDLSFPELQGIDKEMQRKILDVAVDSSPGVSWDDIAGLEGAKRALYEIVVLPALRPELFTGLRMPPSGVLLFGPPGCGKTMLAKAVASEAKCAFFTVSAASLMSKYLGDSEGLVKALFAVARAVAPSVIFIDEIDALLSERSDKEHEASRRVKTEFLVQWDGLIANPGQAKRILVMGATNRPFDLDDAAIRRMPQRVYIPLPDFVTRRVSLQKLLGSTKNRISAADFDWIAQQCEGYSQSDIKALCQQAAMEPLRELGDRILTIDTSAVRGVEQKDFVAAFKLARPSVDPATLGTYEDWKRKFGC